MEVRMLDTKLSRRLAVLLGALVAVGLAAAPACAGKTVKTRGGDSFAPNEYLSSTLHFQKGVIYVKPNERVTWVDADRTGDPHSITTVLRKNLPDTIDEIFACPICSLINNHLNDPNDPDSGLATLRVDKGPAGMQSQGDSLILLPGEKISFRVRAKVGMRIPYLCAIHPWMQGKIIVTRTGTAPTPSLAGR
jgi:plastocyanin